MTIPASGTEGVSYHFLGVYRDYVDPPCVCERFDI